MNVRRVLILCAVALAALPLAACGTKEKVSTFASTEGTYLNVGALSYQVEISRQLNPTDKEDEGYLVDVPPAQRALGPNQSWFAVFLIAFNETDKPQTAASQFSITDTEGNAYTPLTLGPDNLYAYRGGVIPANGQIPALGTAAASNASVNGAMLLFKVDNGAFNNRPLLFKIQDPGVKPSSASVDLDV